MRLSAAATTEKTPHLSLIHISAAMMQQLGMMAPQDDADGDEAPDDDTDAGGDGDFTRGGNATFPFGIFGGRRKAEEAPEKRCV